MMTKANLGGTTFVYNVLHDIINYVVGDFFY
ncbi:hypothetical protein WGH24286_00917 [Periweissella ghanensis]|uniref:Uncharacterized protein n=1 Tax=Periweissella ghanensis TaxID=467997 RepID=A0ABN8BPM9_9LACO|nr:hypothetical protein WGH24286_00917 [Periweissella ghanensis]